MNRSTRTLMMSLAVLLAWPFAAWAIGVGERLSVDHNDPVVVRVHGLSPGDVAALEQQFDVWAFDRDDGYAIIALDDGDALNRLRHLGWTPYRDPERSQLWNASHSHSPLRQSIPDFPCYRTVEETYASAEQIVADHPDLATLIDIGDSWEKTDDANNGYDLRVLKLGNQAIGGDRPSLFVMSAVHAREYTTAETMTRFAEHLIDGYGVNADATWLLDHHDIHLLLQANPDGRKQAETGLFWRKNTNEAYCSPTSQNRGADLNRNFPFQFGGAASTNPCNTTYQGPFSSSEPEVTAVVDYVRGIFDDQRGETLSDPAPLDASGVFIDVHSFSELVLWPWGYNNNAGQAPNQDQLSTLGRRLAFFNAYRPQQILGLTEASGSTADFAYVELGVASFAFELGTDFFELCDTFESRVAPDNINAMIYAARVARAPYQLPSGPDIASLDLIPNTVLGVDTITAQVTADGTRFSTLSDPTSPLEPPRLIAGIDLFVNQLPWIGPTGTVTNPVDGSFDSAVESAVASLSSNGLAQGQHTVFAQAIGEDTQRGPVSAAFLYVLDPATTGNLTGRVLINGTQTPVANALISAGPYQTRSDGSGQYRLDLPASDYTVKVSADGLGSNEVDISLSAQQSLTQDLLLFNRCELFADDVENGNVGWTPDSPWAISTESAMNSNLTWQDSPSGNYQANINVSLTSPAVNLSTATESQLSFDHICNTESGFDFGIVEGSNNGTDWTELYRCSDQESRQNQVIDLGSLDGVATARIRFRLRTDSLVNDAGWTLDNIRISAASNTCEVPAGDDLFADGFEN